MKACSSISEVVSASTITIYCLGRDSDVKEVVSEILKAEVKDKLFVDCSTIHPDTTQEVASLFEAAGARLVSIFFAVITLK